MSAQCPHYILLRFSALDYFNLILNYSRNSDSVKPAPSTTPTAIPPTTPTKSPPISTAGTLSLAELAAYNVSGF